MEGAFPILLSSSMQRVSGQFVGAYPCYEISPPQPQVTYAVSLPIHLGLALGYGKELHDLSCALSFYHALSTLFS